MSIGALTIRSLDERPEAAGTLADWFAAEWPEYHRGKTLADVSTRFRLRPEIEDTLIAEVDGEIVGTISLRKVWDAAPDIPAPWLGSLFVAPDYRGRGIASHLVDAAVERASELGYPTVHVAVREQAASYARRSWRVVGTLFAGDDNVTVMRKDLAAQPS